mmetsp:Transcript_9814/g.26683  ORF Transcript_9814/g.26683 Transcript_9814/m.26683 type:complete len:253 (+) Transcript_9814:1910-2668(+)
MRSLACLARQLIGARGRGDEHAHGLPVARELEECLELVGARPLVVAHGRGVRLGCGASHSGQSHFLYDHAERSLSGLSHALVLVRLGVVGDARLVAKGEHLGEGEETALRRGGLAPGQAHHAALGAVARALHLVLDQRLCRGGTHVHQGHSGHLVGGERARLVGADDGGAAQCLHGGQLAHDGVLLDHLASAEGEAERDHSGQALWDGGHAQRDGDFHVVDAALDEAPVHGVEELAEVHDPDEEADDGDHFG